MLRIIFTFVLVQSFLTKVICLQGNKEDEDDAGTCSYNVIIPTANVIQKCDDYTEVQLKKLRKRLADLQKQVEDGSKPVENVDLLQQCDATRTTVYESCEELKLSGVNETGVYVLGGVQNKAHKIYTEVSPDNSNKPKSYAKFTMIGKGRRTLCDLSTNDGWTVVMQRTNMDVDFNRTWTEYKNGFGNLSKDEDFWWGLDNMYNVTNQKGRSYRLRLDIIQSESVLRRAEYRDIKIDKEADDYRILRGSYDYAVSNATNWLGTFRNFQTWDSKVSTISWNIRYNCVNFAQAIYPGSGGGWWFRDTPSCGSVSCAKRCGSINPNANQPYYEGHSNITSVSMKIRLDKTT